MTTPSPRWLISLTAAPDIVLLGTAVHGDTALSERYHSNLWVILAIHYHGEIATDGEVFTVRPGSVAVFPPGTTLTIRYGGRSMHRYAHLGLRGGRGDELPIAAVSDLGDDFAAFDRQYQEAIRVHGRAPAHASALLWNLLWRIAEGTDPGSGDHGRHPAVRRALEAIEARLGERLPVTRIVAAAGLSQRQLTSLFQREFGRTIVGYLRHRRMARAHYLLTRTAQPVRSIAADVGLPDLQLFNKTVRRELGLSPRALRERGPTPPAGSS